MSKKKKPQAAEKTSENRKGAERNSVSSGNPGNMTGASDMLSQKERKRRYYRRATFLHLFTFIICFGLFIALSARIANQPLMEMHPVSIEGWVFLNEPATGSQKKVDFRLGQVKACELASMFDAEESVYTSEKLEKYGEITFRFVSAGRKRTFFISQNGIRDSQGWKRHKAISPKDVEEILEKAIQEEQLEKPLPLAVDAEDGK